MNKKVALVTGGSGGIGSEICRHLAIEGYKVIVNYHTNGARAKEIVGQLKGQGHITIQASVTESQELKNMADTVSDAYGRLDVLVNNSGITKAVNHANLDALDDDSIDRILQVNIRGVFAGIRAFQNLLKKSQGTVINISSVAAERGVGSNVIYCASKSAVNTMTQSLGRALAPDIKVVCVAPGWVEGDYAKTFPKEYIQSQIEKTPLRRIATPVDVANAVLGVLKHFPFSTGCVFPVDGGRPLL